MIPVFENPASSVKRTNTVKFASSLCWSKTLFENSIHWEGLSEKEHGVSEDGKDIIVVYEVFSLRYIF